MEKQKNRSLLFGPFKQLLTLDFLPEGGPIKDEALQIIPQAAIRVQQGMITQIGSFNKLRERKEKFYEIPYPSVVIPGLIDTHTHLCFAGSRAGDYAKRLSGFTYQEIAKAGGGILQTVRDTRRSSLNELINSLLQRTSSLLKQGVTTCEIKTGYGLDVKNELKMLKAIHHIRQLGIIDIIPTCLAAHTLPPEFPKALDYLNYLKSELFPLLLKQKLTQRIDIFVDQIAFSIAQARSYLQAAKKKGFQICMHADQFSRGGALLAAEISALSADHLEKSELPDFEALKQARVIPIILPGSSLGLGLPYAKARQMLDSGLPVVIASDWNPGSAPMGYLLLQAALLAVAEKLTMAETLAAITTRAAKALQLQDRGILKVGMRADFTVFPCSNYQEILYHQGMLFPSLTLMKGRCIEHV